MTPKLVELNIDKKHTHILQVYKAFLLLNYKE